MPTLEELLARADNGDIIENRITVDYGTKKLVVPNCYQVIGVVGDRNSRRLHFIMDTNSDEMDLTKDNISLWYTNALEETGFIQVSNKSHSNGKSSFSFLIPPALAGTAGKVLIKLCISRGSGNGKVEWHTEPYECEILEYGAHEMNALDPGSPAENALQQLATRITEVEDGVQDMANHVLRID